MISILGIMELNIKFAAIVITLMDCMKTLKSLQTICTKELVTQKII